MAAKSSMPLPSVDVAVTLLQHGNRILAGYNSQWGAFSLPMTKRHVWKDPDLPDGLREETWENAAVRAAAEWIGRTTLAVPQLICDKEFEYRQSDRDGHWKRYSFRVFKLAVESEVLGGTEAYEWLTPAELVDPKRRPVSESAVFIIAELRLQNLL